MKRPEDIFDDFVNIVDELGRPSWASAEFDRLCRVLDTDPDALSDYLLENFGLTGPEVVARCVAMG